MSVKLRRYLSWLIDDIVIWSVVLFFCFAVFRVESELMPFLELLGVCGLFLKTPYASAEVSENVLQD